MDTLTVVCVTACVMMFISNFSWEELIFLAVIVAILKALFDYTGITIACVFLLGIAWYFIELFSTLRSAWQKKWKEKVVNFIWENEEYRAKL